MDDIYTLKRFKKTKNKNYNKPLLLLILILIVLIISKKDPNFKKALKEKVFSSNFSFAKVNEIYKKYAGEIVPTTKSANKEVFNEKLSIEKKEKYLEGGKLTLNSNLIPIQESGLVVFIGNREGYGKTAIIQQTNGIDLIYGNLNEINVELYDYVEKGKLLGSVLKDTLFLVYRKEGKSLDYENYIKG